jgi:hypothetical protein
MILVISGRCTDVLPNRINSLVREDGCPHWFRFTLSLVLLQLNGNEYEYNIRFSRQPVFN